MKLYTIPYKAFGMWFTDLIVAETKNQALEIHGKHSNHKLNIDHEGIKEYSIDKPDLIEQFTWE